MIKVVSGEKIQIGNFIKDGLDHFGPLLASKIIYTIGIFIGYLLFIIPGIYLTIKWFFITHIIINENKSISDAYSKSSKMTDDIFWSIFTVMLINVIISAIGGPLFFVTMPFSTLICAKCYVELSR